MELILNKISCRRIVLSYLTACSHVNGLSIKRVVDSEVLHKLFSTYGNVRILSPLLDIRPLSFLSIV
jgi:hypothetical protein